MSNRFKDREAVLLADPIDRRLLADGSPVIEFVKALARQQARIDAAEELLPRPNNPESA